MVALVLALYGAADWMTASISVQGSYLVGCHDLVTGDSGDEPGRVVVRSRYCHFCCHRPAGRRWTTRRAARPNRISSSGRHGSESFRLDQHARSVLRVPRCTALNCNPQIRRSGQVVQDRPSPVVGWADIPELSACVRRCPAAWQQRWQQSRRPLGLPYSVRTLVHCG
jgi:hypothetical protein